MLNGTSRHREQAVRSSVLSDKSREKKKEEKKKWEEKKGRKGQADQGRLQANNPLPKGKHLDGRHCAACRRCCSVGERVKLKYKTTHLHSPTNFFTAAKNLRRSFVLKLLFASYCILLHICSTHFPLQFLLPVEVIIRTIHWHLDIALLRNLE